MTCTGRIFDDIATPKVHGIFHDELNRLYLVVTIVIGVFNYTGGVHN